MNVKTVPLDLNIAQLATLARCEATAFARAFEGDGIAWEHIPELLRNAAAMYVRIADAMDEIRNREPE